MISSTRLPPIPMIHYQDWTWSEPHSSPHWHLCGKDERNESKQSFRHNTPTQPLTTKAYGDRFTPGSLYSIAACVGSHSQRVVSVFTQSHTKPCFAISCKLTVLWSGLAIRGGWSHRQLVLRDWVGATDEGLTPLHTHHTLSTSHISLWDGGREKLQSSWCVWKVTQ